MDTQTPTLLHLEDFKTSITNYELSDHAKNVLAQTKLVVMLGVAGGGRNTLINYLTTTGPYYFIVSDTTRPPKVRDGKLEAHGTHYFFRTEDDFLKDLDLGEFIEAEIIHNQQVSGTSIRELQWANEQGLIGIHDFDIGGAANIAQLKPDAYVVGLLPPSFTEWQRRLSGREKMHNKEFANRMQTAVRILQDMIDKPYFKFIISDDVHHSSLALRRLVEEDEYTEEQHQKGLETAREILRKTKALIKIL